MGDPNSLAVYTTLFQQLVHDIAAHYTNSEVGRDWMKIQSRLTAEGLSFLTKTLPRLGKALDRALQGDVPLLLTGFQKRPGSGVPKLFWWLLERIIGENGYVRSNANGVDVKHARQILYFLYKLELPNDEKTNNKVLESFVKTEDEIKTLEIDFDDAVITRARGFISRVLAGTNARDIIPRHGPGAVATGERMGQKTHFSRIYSQLDRVYPFTEYNQVSLTQVVDQYTQYEGLEVLETGTAKVVLVPKDSRGPRLISCEPLEYQWIQQGQQRKLYGIVENHRLTKGHVNFTDQTVNRALALKGSLTGAIVTLDMKDASDRVSLALVRSLFSGTEWLQGLEASRTTATRLPDGRRVELAKFAPMGSAVCFPIEALCFFALAVSVLVVHKQIPERVARESVFVYGDDLICNREDYAIIMQHFPRFGLRFNTDKCCVAGFFRESCGCDAYKGVDVTPIRLRTTWSRRKTRDASVLVSYVELSNSLYAREYRRSAYHVQCMVESLYGPLPVVEHRISKVKGSSQDHYTKGSQIIGWYRPDVNPIAANIVNRIPMRYCASVHNDQVRGYVSVPVYEHWSEDGWEACARALIAGSTGLQTGVYAVARRSCLKRKWGTSSSGGYLRLIRKN